MKIVERTLTKPTGTLLFGLIYINFRFRNGNVIRLVPDCDEVIIPGRTLHAYGVYLQIGGLGGNIMFRSNKCLEEQ